MSSDSGLSAFFESANDDKDIDVVYSQYTPYPGAHYPERATSLFSCNGVFTSRVIFRYAFPAKFTVPGYMYVCIEI